MGFADQTFRAVVDADRPSSFGSCDGCGGWYNRVALKPQMEYRGDMLQWTGFLYCYRCISQPQSQLLTPVLPEDPTPVDNPRVEYFVQDQNLNGFTQYNGIQQAAQTPNGLAIRSLPQTSLNNNDPFVTSAQLLSSALSGWGQPQPALTDRSGTTTFAGIGQQIMAANPARAYLLLYSPSGTMLAAAQNGPPSLNLPASSLANVYGPRPTPADVGTVFLGTGQGLLQNGLTGEPLLNDDGTEFLRNERTGAILYGNLMPNGQLVWTGSVWVTGQLAKQQFFAFEG